MAYGLGVRCAGIGGGEFGGWATGRGGHGSVAGNDFCGSGGEPAVLVECFARDVEMAADVEDGVLVLQHFQYRLAVGHQDFELCAAAFAPAEDYSVGLTHGECLLGPHRNQVPFDFRNQSEGEAKYFAVDAVVEGVSFFCGVEPDFFPEAFGHDFHNVGEGAAEPGNLGDDECVTGLETAQQKSKLPLLFVFFTAYYFCNPAVDGNLSGCRVTEDLLLLVGQMLLASADPEITCYHVSSII